MKVIPFYQNEKKLIQKAVKGHSQSQQLIFERFSPKMLGVCRRYIKDLHYAEDVMIEGFVQAFNKLHTFKFEGSFEGWLRMIMVRRAIAFLKKQQFVVYDEESFPSHIQDVDAGAIDQMGEEEIQNLIDELPQGYRMVFVMYAVEGYKHGEIAALLDITEGTSKSQLAKARKMLQSKLCLTHPERLGAQKL